MKYGDAPWIFKGRALYQLQLVPSDEARKYIPDTFKLVELFGDLGIVDTSHIYYLHRHTLGGFYLARYSDSPIGAFDEVVALAGLVWNAPTSCAWAARVYVDKKQARDHGIRDVGLPSRLASFREVVDKEHKAAEALQPVPASWWRQPHPPPDVDLSSQQHGGQAAPSPPLPSGSFPVELHNVDRRRGRGLKLPVCTFLLPASRPLTHWAGPRIKLPLPSFSGGTLEHPGLLQYVCHLATNVRPVKPAHLLLPPVTMEDIASSSNSESSKCGSQLSTIKTGGEMLTCVLRGRPVLALAFDNMEMTVLEPRVLELQPTGRGAPVIS